MPSLRSTLPYILLPAAISAASLDCRNIRVGGQSFNLEKLGGPKTVHDVRWESPSIQNTTFTIDICNTLKPTPDAKKGEDCQHGSRVCAREWDSKPNSDAAPFLKEVITIAGEFSGTDGRHRALDPKYTRLKGSAGNSEEKEGVVVELHGGKYPNTRDGTPQKAIVEFLCDTEWKGTEGFEEDEGKMMSYGAMERRKEGDGDEDDDAPELPDQDKGKALQFVRYEMDTDNAIKVLRLLWKTEHACEGASSKPDKGDGDGAAKSKGWGFFTWLIIVLFLLAAAYIVFGSFLNYSRYGARGWDLVPHGDTIRDIPYIVKDWGQGMTERLRGDSRGGYSAV